MSIVRMVRMVRMVRRPVLDISHPSGKRGGNVLRNAKSIKIVY
jgi:hypothetical protein